MKRGMKRICGRHGEILKLLYCCTVSPIQTLTAFIRKKPKQNRAAIVIQLYHEQGQEFYLFFPLVRVGERKNDFIDCFLSDDENFRGNGKLAHMTKSTPGSFLLTAIVNAFCGSEQISV